MRIVRRAARLSGWIFVALAASGCVDAYLVKQADLERVAVPASGAGWVVPAMRKNRTPVLLRTATLTYDEGFLFAQRQTTSPASCFYRADAFQRTGRFKESARQLRLCLQNLEQLDAALTDDDQIEIKEAIKSLEEGNGAGVSIRALPVAAAWWGDASPGSTPRAASAMRSREIRVRAKNPVQTAGLVLAVAGGTMLAIDAILVGIGAPGCQQWECLGALVFGSMFGAIGLVPLITGVVLSITAIHRAEASPSFVARHEPQWSNPAELAAARTKARRMAIGGGVSAAISFALVASGAVMASHYGPLTPQNPAGQITLTAGESLLGVGLIASVPSVVVLVVGLINHAGMPRGPVMPIVTPWATAQSGGLAVTGRF